MLISPVIVAGHTGCGGCIAAWGAPHPTSANSRRGSPLARFLDPVVRLRHNMPANTEVDDLIKENVRVNVRNVKNSDVSCSFQDVSQRLTGGRSCRKRGGGRREVR